MREIDFLPDWYPALQRRYRALIAQAWVTLAIILLLSGFALAKRSQVNRTEQVVASSERQARLSRSEMTEVNAKLQQAAELRRQDKIVNQLGLDVDSTRLLKSLEDAMTPDMALTNLTMQAVDHRLKVEMDGLAPTDVQAAKLLENLLKVKCFENPAIVYMRDGHSMREFEVTFEMNLNSPAEDR